MTRAEAEAFLERNPKIKKLYYEQYSDRDRNVWSKLDRIWLFGDVTNEADGRVDIVQVFKALERKKKPRRVTGAKRGRTR